MSKLIFLKLGGSLITDKTKPYTPLLNTIDRLATEIATAKAQNPDLQLIIGHGSGSFGHVSGKKYNTRKGVKSPEQWYGFSQVWHDARTLNQYVVEALHEANLPIIAFPPSTSVITTHGAVTHWDITPMKAALSAGLIPIIQGDVIFDTKQGGTILSTEELFIYLARQLFPDHILLAGIEPGVWQDFPTCTSIISRITPSSYSNISTQVSSSNAVDVTGGMAQKVQTMVTLIEEIPHLSASIYSGTEADKTRQSLLGNLSGTIISNQ